MWDKLAQYLVHDLSKDQVHAVMRVGYRGLIAFHILFACGWLSFLGLAGFAKAAETEGLRGQVALLRADFSKAQAQDRVDKLEQEVAGIEQEIFTIEAKLAESSRLGQQADSLYTSRLYTLKSKKGAVERELSTARQHPALAPPTS